MEHLLAEAKEQKEKETLSLDQIMTYANKLSVATAELKALELQVKEKKSEVNQLSQGVLPDAMTEAGLQKLELADGSKLEVKEMMSYSVKDMSLLQKFLEERGDDALLKTSLELGKLPSNIVTMVLRTLKDEFSVEAEHKTTIHAATLKAYFNNLLGLGKQEAEMIAAELDEDMISHYSYYKTTVK